MILIIGFTKAMFSRQTEYSKEAKLGFLVLYYVILLWKNNNTTVNVQIHKGYKGLKGWSQA